MAKQDISINDLVSKIQNGELVFARNAAEICLDFNESSRFIGLVIPEIPFRLHSGMGKSWAWSRTKS
jgi:hypothetical protein